ncbi:MAG: tetratricopeptide repeat protein [Elusimicrobiaceae bacterium]|nr:tetratricopeptide repeat protein [Elusimicrobiaceae bacterium]
MRGYILKTVLTAVIMAVSAFAMWPSVNGGFVSDDPNYVAGNPQIRDLSPLGIKNIFTRPHLGLYKPVTMLSLAVNYRFSGLDPRPYHITNVTLHALNAALVFAFILLLTQNGAAAFLCALLFGVHPLHVESVAWIAERKDMLYALFFLLSSILYAAYAKTGRRAELAGSILCFALSLAAKPAGITLPAALFIYDYLLRRGFSRQLLLEKIPYLLVAGAFGAWNYFLLDSTQQVRTAFNLADRILFVFYGLKFYIVKLLWPANLSAVYPFPVKNGNSLPPEYWLGPVTVILCALLLFKYFRKTRPVMAGLAFYCVTLLPVLQFVNVGTVITADKYSYIPALGLFMPLSVYAIKGLTTLRHKNIRLAGAAAVCAAALLGTLITAARARCRVWENDYTLFSDAAAKYPDTSTLNYFAAALRDSGQPDRAREVFEMAIKLSLPMQNTASNANDVFLSYTSLAGLLRDQGRNDEAEKMLSALRRLKPDFAPMLFLLADVQARKGRLKTALELFDQASRSASLEAPSCALSGDIYMRLGDYARAKEHYDRAHRLDPQYPPAENRMPGIKTAAD